MAESRKAWHAWASHVAETLMPKVAALLGVDPFQYKIVVDPNLPATDVATTDNNTQPPTITLSAAHLDQVGNDPGEIAHELVHAATGNTDVNSKFTEAMADAVRLKLGLTPVGWTPTKLASEFASLDPTQMHAAESDMQNGTFNPSNLVSKTPQGGGQPTVVYQSPSTNSTGVGGLGGGVIGAGGTLPGSSTKPATGKVITYTDPNTGITVKGIDTTGDGVPDVGPTGTGIPILAGTGTGSPQNTAATFTSWLMNAGLDPNAKDVQALIAKGSQGAWNLARFETAVYKTQTFQQAFPGIFNADGSLKMSVSQYLQTKTNYQNYAAQYGINLTPKVEAMLFRNDVSSNEAQMKFQADQQLRDNPALFQAYNQELKQQGLAPLDHGGIINFLIGQGNKQYYQVWQDANTRYQAEQAGLSFGHVAGQYTALSQGTVARIAGMGLTPDAQHALFQKTASDLLTTFPLSKLQGYGLTKKMIVEANAGGPKQAQVLQLMDHIQKTEAAQYQPRADVQAFATAGQGVKETGGAGERAQA